MKKLKLIVCVYYLTVESVVKKISTEFNNSEIEFECILVNNISSAYGNKYALPANFSLLEGSNKFLDFSAYSEGLNYFKSSNIILEEFAFLFFNDKFLISHPYALIIKLFKLHFPILSHSDVPVICGVGNNYKNIIFSNPWSSNNLYVPTYFFALNSRALSFFDALKIDSFSGDYESYGISAQFSYFLDVHSTLAQSYLKWGRGNHFPNLLNKKRFCIMCEHKLSGEIMANGVALILNAGLMNKLKVILWVFLKRIFIFTR